MGKGNTKPVKQVKNRKPGTWKPGQSGNPKGRPPKGWSWAELLEEVGEQVEEKSGKKFKELVSKRLWVECVNGNISAIKELMNRMDGMPIQKNILGGDDDRPIPIDVKLIISQIYGNKTNTPTEVSDNSQKRRKSSRSS